MPKTPTAAPDVPDTDAGPLTLQDRFYRLEDTLNVELVERRSEIRAAMIALVAGAHVFFLGPPGVAKSLLVDRIHAYITGANAFSILMSRFTTSEEIFGPVSLRGLEEDRFVRQIDGYLATAEIAFLDEVFKANSSILNALLWAINERRYRHGNDVIEIPLSTLFCASNELPQDESLSALYDRLMFRFEVKPVRDPANFMRMLRTHRPERPEPIMSWQDVQAAQAEAAEVVVPDVVFEALTELRRQLKERDIEPTERRFVQAMKIVRANAWLDESDVADVEHLRPLEHCLWTDPSQIAEVAGIVLKLANPLDQEAHELLAEIDKLEDQLNSIGQDEEKHRKGSEIHNKLRLAKKELDSIQERAGNSRRRSETIAEARDRLHNLTHRVLREVFSVDPNTVDVAAAGKKDK